MVRSIQIANRLIGDDHPTFIVAELSANHNQDFNIAVETIKAMKKAGADAVKLQTYTADTLTINCDNEYFIINQQTLWDGKTLYELYQEAYTPWDWQPKLMKIAKEEGLICFSTPFDFAAVDFLDECKVPAFKVASFEIFDTPLIEYIASKGMPVIISTGVAEKEDIQLAVDTCRKAGNDQIILLKCTSSYPAPVEEANLKTIPDIQQTFKTLVGLSDHTLGISVPIASVALGAKVVEKHFILDKKLGGPDASFSLEPEDFKEMVTSIRKVEKALGRINYKLTEQAKKNKVFSRSIFVIADISEGEIFTEKNIRSIRPGYGLHPKYYREILGKKAKENIPRGTPLHWDHIY